MRIKPKTKRHLSAATLYVALTITGIIFVMPLLWMISTAFKLPAQTYVYPPVWIPSPITIQNFVDAFNTAPLAMFIKNSVIVTSLAVTGSLISCSMVAFAFGRLRWFGRDFLFLILLATMMLPSQVTMIPVFIIFHRLGWVNSLRPLFVPSFFAGGVQGAFYVFMLRQFIMGIPRDLDEAATIDGCGYFQIYFRMILPLLKPALGAVAIFSFMDNWNEFMSALIYLNDQRLYTLPIGLQYFRYDDIVNWNQLMSASLVALFPCIAIFFLGQKCFMRGIALGASKG